MYSMNKKQQPKTNAKTEPKVIASFQAARIARMTRLYAMLTAINEMLIRTESRQDLFAKACQLVVEQGGFTFAWVGEIDAANNGISLAAHSCAAAGQLDPERLQQFVEAQVYHSGSIAAKALLNKNRQVLSDLAHDQTQKYWYELAEQMGLQSVAAFPLFCRQQPSGVLCVYAAEAWHFDEDEIRLLTQLADDISFALNLHDKALQRAEIELSLKENEIRYQSLFEQSSDAVFLTDLESGSLLECNPAACRLYGYQRNELLELKDQDLSREPEKTREAVGQRKTFIPLIWHARRDQQQFPVEIEQSFFDWQGRPVCISTVRDITERFRHEEAQRQQYGLVKAILDVMPFRVCIINQEYKVIYANPAMEQDLGKVSDMQFCYNYYHGRNAPCPWCRNDEVFNGRTVEWEWTNSVTGVTYAVFEMPFALGGDVPAKLEILQDISRQKHLQRELLQAQKMESVGRLAGGIAHDFNNLLQAITGFGEILRDEMETKDPHREDVEQILKAADHAASLTRQILLFSRRQVVEFGPVDVNKTIENVIKIIGRVLGEKIVLETVLAEDLPGVYGDSGQIEQVVVNMAINARDAMPQGGVLCLSTKERTFSAKDAAVMPGARPGHFVCMQIKDNGVGIDAALMDRIFEPFFTTKRAGQGSGMGLAVVLGIVQEHGGWIDVRSTPAQGTVFSVFLPVPDGSGSDVTAKMTEVTSSPLPYAGRGQRILVVEDQAGVRSVLRRILPAHGYRIFTAADCAEGIEIFEQYHGAFDLLLLDVVLPDGNGVDLAGKMLKKHPGIKVLLSSGYLDDKVRLSEIKNNGWSFIEKPYEMTQILTAIENLLSDKK